MLTDTERRDVYHALIGILGKQRGADFFLEGIASDALSAPTGRGPTAAPAGVHPGVQSGSAGGVPPAPA